jgi:tellurite resistance protein TehA-like permease
MMDGAAWMMPGMMWGMGLLWLLLVIVLVLAAAALVKYLFFEGRRRDG